MRYINMDFSDHDLELDNKIEKDEQYSQAWKEFNDAVDKLDKESRIEIDGAANYMEALAKDIAFDEGFKEGVRFILGCLSDGKGIAALEALVTGRGETKNGA